MGGWSGGIAGEPCAAAAGEAWQEKVLGAILISVCCIARACSYHTAGNWGTSPATSHSAGASLLIFISAMGLCSFSSAGALCSVQRRHLLVCLRPSVCLELFVWLPSPQHQHAHECSFIYFCQCHLLRQRLWDSRRLLPDFSPVQHP